MKLQKKKGCKPVLQANVLGYKIMNLWNSLIPEDGPSVFYAPLGLGFRVRVMVRVRVRSVISVSFRVRIRVTVSADMW